MSNDAPLIQLSERGQVTLPADVRRALGLHAGDAFRVEIEEGRIVLQPVEVMPVELYSDERIAEFLAAGELTEEELAEARARWGL